MRGLPEALGELPVATLADEMETPGPGQVRALLTIAGNPALTTPDAGRLDGLLAGLELMVCVDPYLNATTRHADVILPPPSVLQKSHYDLAFTALSVRNVSDFSPAVFEREPGSPSEFEILVRLAAIAAGLGADADPAALAATMLAVEIAKAIDDPTSPIHGRDAAEIERALGDRPVEERLLDLMLRTGHRGDGFGARPDGISLAMLEHHPHGIDFGPLEPRLPDALDNGVRKGRACASISDRRSDPARARPRRHGRGRHGAGRPPPAADGQLVDAERARARAREGQLRRAAPSRRCGAGSVSWTAPPPR